MPKKIKQRDIVPFVDEVTQNFKGQINELEQAIGMWIVGRQFGWKVMLLVHDRKTIAKYEKILGIDFRNEVPDVGEYAHKSVAWRAVLKVSNFWKAVKGEISGVRSPDFD
jgi:hypothetical protein